MSDPLVHDTGPVTGLTGRTALVTGAATGIGAATAIALARAGAAVAVNHWCQPELAGQVVAAIEQDGGRATAIEADVRVAKAVANMVARVRDAFGTVDVLVNNAGVISRALCGELAESEWDRVIDTNLKGVFLCCKYVVPDMMSRRWGRIINISSELALLGEAKLIHYCAAKGGVLAMTRALARELIGHGINVNSVAPGMIETPMLTANAVTFNARTRSGIPARRWGRPEEVAKTILFLTSDAADYYVGWTFSPNGGVVM